MEDVANVSQLSAFVVDFTYNRLSRFYRTEPENSTAWTNVATTEPQCATLGSICIRTVTSATFEKVVMDPEKVS